MTIPVESPQTDDSDDDDEDDDNEGNDDAKNEDIEVDHVDGVRWHEIAKGCPGGYPGSGNLMQSILRRITKYPGRPADFSTLYPAPGGNVLKTVPDAPEKLSANCTSHQV